MSSVQSIEARLDWLYSICKQGLTFLRAIVRYILSQMIMGSGAAVSIGPDSINRIKSTHYM